MAPAAVKPGGKDCDNFQHIRNQFFLKSCLFGGIDDDNLRAEVFTKGKDQFRAKAQEAILVANDQPPNLARADAPNEQSQALLVIVQARAKILQRLKSPSVGRAERLKQSDLSNQVVFLIVARYLAYVRVIRDDGTL